MNIERHCILDLRFINKSYKTHNCRINKIRTMRDFCFNSLTYHILWWCIIHNIEGNRVEGYGGKINHLIYISVFLCIASSFLLMYFILFLHNDLDALYFNLVAVDVKNFVLMASAYREEEETYNEAPRRSRSRSPIGNAARSQQERERLSKCL